MLTTRPREGTFRRSPLAELGGDTCLFAGNMDGCRVGRGSVARPREGREGGAASQGIMKPNTSYWRSNATCLRIKYSCEYFTYDIAGNATGNSSIIMTIR